MRKARESSLGEASGETQATARKGRKTPMGRPGSAELRRYLRWLREFPSTISSAEALTNGDEPGLGPMAACRLSPMPSGGGLFCRRSKGGEQAWILAVGARRDQTFQ